MTKINKILPFLILFLFAFTLPLNPPPSGWYQQFMPNIGNRTISDITFIDSLNGYAIANSTSDTNYFMRTTNGGDNWQIVYRKYLAMEKMQFLNLNTGYMCGAYLWKTTDGGLNWNQVNAPSISPEGLYVIDQNLIWIISSEPLTGGVFFTSNGGQSWQPQFSGGNQNPNKIYMYNARIGFICNYNAASPNIYWTTNGGLNWAVNLTGEYFYDMHFTDSLTGWKCMPGFIAGDSCVKKTTNGGISWVKQILPQGGIINLSQIVRFSFINKDTIWGVGGSVYYSSNGYRGILYRTINGGTNWLFQVPDTSIHFVSYSFIHFIDKRIGWVYRTTQGGIHTTDGGDTTFYTGLQKISSKIPEQFKLYQNYPNPFNPRTNIKYQIAKSSYVKLTIFDVTGKVVMTLVDQKQNEGTYMVDFSGNGYSSGVYFYQLKLDGNTRDTKKMILLK